MAKKTYSRFLFLFFGLTVSRGNGFKFRSTKSNPSQKIKIALLTTGVGMMNGPSDLELKVARTAGVARERLFTGSSNRKQANYMKICT